MLAIFQESLSTLSIRYITSEKRRQIAGLCDSSLLKKKNSTRLGQLRKSTGEFSRSAQGTPMLTSKKLRPARFARPAQFITIELYSLMVLFW